MYEKASALDSLPDAGDTTKPKVESEELHSPVDRGWAWLVMIGAFTNLSAIMIFTRSASILFIMFLEKYQESATMTTMSFMFSSAMFALCNIIGPACLFQRFEVRTLAIAGGAINFLSVLVIAFAPNIFLIYVMMASLGFSHGLISVPQMTLIGQYFKKRLAFAAAFVSLGLSVATISGPPLTQILLDLYGLQGAIIILAGINMNCIPASMLFRPTTRTCKQVDLHTIPANRKQGLQDKNIVDDVYIEQAIGEPGVKRAVYEQTDMKVAEESLSLIRSISEEHSPRSILVSERDHNDAFGTISMGADTSHVNFIGETSRDNENDIVSSLIDKISLSSSIRYLTDINVSIVDSFPKDQDDRENLKGEDLSVNANSKIPSMEAIQHSAEMCLKRTSEESSQEADSKQTCFIKVHQSITGSVYVNPLAILLLLASGLGVQTQMYISYMPSLGKENGLTNDQAPYLVTVFGVSDLVGKLAIGFFADLGYVKRVHIVCVAEATAGTLLQFVGYLQGFGPMILLQVGLGLTGSTLHTLLAVITVDFLGLQHLGHIMAGYFLVNGITLSINHIVMGAIKDLTGSFVIGFNYTGSLVLLSVLLLLFEPLIARYKSARS